MKIINLVDDQYPFTKTTHVRTIARGVVMTDDGYVGLTKLLYEDPFFGRRDYFELPGGGVNQGETIKEAFLREMEEELGFKVEIIEEVAQVNDFYNLIGRENHNHFFLARRLGFVGTRLEEKEKEMISEIVWVTLKEAIKLYEKMGDSKLSTLVKSRELPVLKIVYERQVGPW